MFVDLKFGLVYVFVLLLLFNFWGGNCIEDVFLVIFIIVLDVEIGKVVWLW